MDNNTGVQYRHNLWERNRWMWRSVRDSIEGTNAVKRANAAYLPIPSGFLGDSSSPSSSIHSDQNFGSGNHDDYLMQNAPWYHRNPAYRAYLQRARFPEITIHTLRGLIGIATRKEIEFNLPAKISHMEDSATKTGSSLEELFVICLSEVLCQGRFTLVVDVDPIENKTVIIPYPTETFINWDGSDGETTLAVFEEQGEIYNPGEEFEKEQKTINLAYSWYAGEGNEFEGIPDDMPHVSIRKYIDGVMSSIIVPNLQGTEFDTIPVVSIGSLKNCNEPNPSPLLGIAEIAYSIYRKDADLSNAEYMTCNPMLTITGAETDGSGGVPLNFGSQVALLVSNPEAKVFFPATDTSALAHVSERISEMFTEAAQYGASLIGPDKKAAEAFETVKARQGAQGATLVGVVNNVIKGIEKALMIAATISGANPDEVSLDISTDFSERLMSPQMLTALVMAWQNGAVSRETVLRNAKEAGLLKRDEDIEEEIVRIDSAGPAGGME